MNINELKLVTKSIMESIIEYGIKEDRRTLALQKGDWETAQKINLKNFKKPSLSIIGEAGIGKTEAIEQVATEMGVPCLTFRVGEFVDNGDIQGMPRIVEKNGVLKTVTILPEFYPQPMFDSDGKYMTRKDGGIMYDYEGVKEYIENYDELYEYYKGDINQAPGLIVFYDELNRVSAEDVKNALFKIFEKQKIGRYQFPSSTFLIAATNPNTDDYGVSDILEEKAFKTRFIHVEVEKDNELFLDYMRAQGFDKRVRRFVRQKTDEINVKGDSYDLNLQANSRTIAYANSLVQYMELDKKLPRELFQEVISGIVGVSAVTFTDIVYGNFKDKIEVEDIIFRYEETEKELKNLTNEDIDSSRLTQLKDDMLEYLFEIGDSTKRIEIFSKNQENFEKFIEVFPDEYCFSFFKEMLQKDKEDQRLTKPWNQIFARSNRIAERIINLNKRAEEPKDSDADELPF